MYLSTDANHCLLLWTLEGVRQDVQLFGNQASQPHCHDTVSWCRTHAYCTFSLVNTIFAISELFFFFEDSGHKTFCEVCSSDEQRSFNSVADNSYLSRDV